MNMTNEEKILEMLVQLQTDVSGMKNRLGNMEEQMNQLDDKSQRTAVLLETEINHKLDLLYEGHGMIMEHLDKLASKSRVEELESDDEDEETGEAKEENEPERIEKNEEEKEEGTCE